MKTQSKFLQIIAIFMMISTHLFSQSLIIKQDEKTELYGLVDENENWVIKPKYKEVDFNFKEVGLFYIKDTKDKIGFINAKGQEIVKCQYDDYREDNGFFVVEKKQSEMKSFYGLLDSTGREVIPTKYSWINNTIKQGGVILQDNETYFYGVTDAKGKTIIPFTLPYIKSIYKSVIIARQENPGLDGLLDTKNNWIVPCSYNLIEQFSETDDLAMAVKNGKMGFIDLIGKIVVPLEYDVAFDENGSLVDYRYGFLNGFVPIKKNGKWGVINTSNKVVIPYLYDEVTKQEGTKYTFLLKGESFTIDAKTR
jgi:hypothetical protein